MPELSKTLIHGLNIRRYSLLFAGLWTLSVGASLGWNLAELTRQPERQAFAEAKVSVEKDLSYRFWASTKGGVYVPFSPETPPNPYLANIPKRDIVTKNGDRLTLVNPAYMTRQVHEMSFAKFGTRAHITSLNPLRPENSPDPWERQALEKFEKYPSEAGDISSKELIAGAPHMRLIRPLLTEKSCLQCHAQQGYKEGEIRGGLSVSVPLTAYQAALKPQQISLVVAHFGLWMLGVLGFAAFNRNIGQRIALQRNADERLRHSLDEKDALLRELYHRTKNNMQVISSLLSLQSMRTKDKNASQVLDDTRDRIRSMALVHEKLYRSKDLSKVDLGDYVRDFVQLMMSSHNMVDRKIEVVTDVDPILLNIETAIPLGLILNELISNSLKHAFPETTNGSIHLTITRDATERIHLSYADDGAPFPGDFDLLSQKTLGMQLIRTLGETQLKGKLSLAPQTKQFDLVFSEPSYTPHI